MGTEMYSQTTIHIYNHLDQPQQNHHNPDPSTQHRQKHVYLIFLQLGKITSCNQPSNSKSSEIPRNKVIET